MLYTLKNPEPSQPKYAMLVAADAKAIGAVGAMRPGGANKKPRTFACATDCKVTRADGTTFIIPARAARTGAPARKHHKVVRVAEDRRSELFRSY